MIKWPHQEYMTVNRIPTLSPSEIMKTVNIPWQ